MAIIKSGLMFLKSIDGSGEIKDKYFIVRHMRDVIMKVGSNNVVQIITDNVAVCKAAYAHRIGISFNLLDSLCSAHLESCIEKYLCNKNYEKE